MSVSLLCLSQTLLRGQANSAGPRARPPFGGNPLYRSIYPTKPSRLRSTDCLPKSRRPPGRHRRPGVLQYRLIGRVLAVRLGVPVWAGQTAAKRWAQRLIRRRILNGCWRDTGLFVPEVPKKKESPANGALQVARQSGIAITLRAISTQPSRRPGPCHSRRSGS